MKKLYSTVLLFVVGSSLDVQAENYTYDLEGRLDSSSKADHSYDAEGNVTITFQDQELFKAVC